jgi:hypothetical protein
LPSRSVNPYVKEIVRREVHILDALDKISFPMEYLFLSEEITAEQTFEGLSRLTGKGEVSQFEVLEQFISHFKDL